ncbi:adenine nucleotide alpha hydrolases-likesuperfamily protein [Striga asiatica]|uniref:Adenine nucleotide alpha hydrolases-likesuperfamily protein n=1 Tax=Striga asiatica TaxID=4170 RepID=A0A5A7QYY5_STRAF|nr:adenine nucleotide alpha hydrolases-likesuperfamily protein [Striga asiatica]
MPTSDSYLRQLSSKGVWKSSSKRWAESDGRGCGPNLGQIDGLKNICGVEKGSTSGVKKRVMVVLDQPSHSKHAMMWALTHVAHNGDIFTLLQIVSHSKCNKGTDDFSSQCLVASLGSLCKACKPEVEVEALVIHGPKMATIMSQVKKLEVSVLVLGQKKISPFLNCLFIGRSTEEFVEECINSLECLTIGVRKQSKGVNGYLISTKWHKNFWLLA